MQRASTYLGKRVSIMLADGRHYLGVLRGIDQVFNLSVADAVEMTYDGAAPQEWTIGAGVFRGDDVAYIGLIDTIEEAGIDRLHPTAAAVS